MGNIYFEGRRYKEGECIVEPISIDPYRKPTKPEPSAETEGGPKSPSEED